MTLYFGYVVYKDLYRFMLKTKNTHTLCLKIDSFFARKEIIIKNLFSSEMERVDVRVAGHYTYTQQPYITTHKKSYLLNICLTFAI